MKTVRATLLVDRVVKVVYDIEFEDRETITDELIEDAYLQMAGETYDERVNEETVYSVIEVVDEDGNVMDVPNSDEEELDVT